MSNNNILPTHGILNEADIGQCPSCSYTMALPRFMDLDKLQTCPKCGASSYGYKWQSDKGYSAFRRMQKFSDAMQNFSDAFESIQKFNAAMQKFSAAMKEDNNDKK